MRSSKDKKRFLEILEETPLVSIAAKRAGIAKATIYRWKEKDNDFSKKLEQAIEDGSNVISDRVESVLIKKAYAGEKWAVEMWLESNRKKYVRPRRPISAFDFDNLYKTNKIIVEILATREAMEKDLKDLEERKKNGGPPVRT